ncbi:hypothetical protein LCGC14_0347750 [marine sediment metagenome]|uniref:Uncharacterized protein n=1 Tax=marine sediment metagenome TaxID=412755 RepID=A0A0F9WJQ3_9ZZZZ
MTSPAPKPPAIKKAPAKATSLEELITPNDEVEFAPRLLMANFGGPGSFKTRIFATACEVEETSPLLYIPYEPIPTSIPDLLARDDFDVLEPRLKAGTKSLYKFTIEDILPLIAKSQGKYRAYFFDGVCSLMMDSAFADARRECHIADLSAASRNSKPPTHSEDYPCRQCYNRLVLKAQIFISGIRDLWKSNPDGAAHILMSFREKNHQTVEGKGDAAITISTFKADLPAATLRMMTHDIQTYFRLQSSWGPVKDEKGQPVRGEGGRGFVSDYRLNITAARSDAVDARDNSGKLKGAVNLGGRDIHFFEIYNRMYPGQGTRKVKAEGFEFSVLEEPDSKDKAEATV